MALVVTDDQRSQFNHVNFILAQKAEGKKALQCAWHFELDITSRMITLVNRWHSMAQRSIQFFFSSDPRRASRDDVVPFDDTSALQQLIFAAYSNSAHRIPRSWVCSLCCLWARDCTQATHLLVSCRQLFLHLNCRDSWVHSVRSCSLGYLQK